MFDKLTLNPPDALLGLIKAYQADQREGKVDLGVGVFRDHDGKTPVMKAVKLAEERLLKQQDSKRYLAPQGDGQFVALLKPIIFGAVEKSSTFITGVQTPGGSGALRLAADIIKASNTGAEVWVGTPTWPNHRPVLAAAGLTIRDYAYADVKTQTIDFASMREALNRAKPGDVFLLHGCCHNPVGMDLDEAQWREVASLMKQRQLVPFIDLAYQGLGDSLEKDAAASQIILAQVDEALLAYSCDKNFGLYRDRVGALYAFSHNEENAKKAFSNMEAFARVSWSMPPDHGAAVVRLILEDQALTKIWRDELTQMCERINHNRQALAAAHPKLAFIKAQKGLFSNLAMSRDQAKALREKHAIYLADSGRINLAGLQDQDVPKIVAALQEEGCL